MLTYKQQKAILLIDRPDALTVEYIVEITNNKKEWRKKLADNFSRFLEIFDCL